jgi:N-acyl-D-amino-acid deacylase
MGGRMGAPTKKELLQMVKAVQEGMSQGAFGVSTGLIYPPACFSKISEMVRLAKVCKEFDGIFTFHMRSESDGLIEAVKEAIEIGKKAKVPIQISHIKTSGQRNWGKIDAVLDLIEQSQKEGLDVAADRYPYIASQTGLMQVLPEWTFEGGIKELLKRLRDKKTREKIKKGVLMIHPPEEDYLNKVLIMEHMSKKNKKFEGLTVYQAAEKVRKDPFEFLFDLLIEEEAAISAIYFTMSEENLRRFFSKDYIFVASDSGCRSIKGPLAKGKPHPRIFGTFPRVIRKYVREERLLDLKKAIYKMTWQPAERFKIEKRGKIAEGFYADLVLFDFDKISDRSDFLDPFHYAEGIEYVWINGVCAVEKGKLTGKKAGHPLKKIG